MAYPFTSIGSQFSAGFVQAPDLHTAVDTPFDAIRAYVQNRPRARLQQTVAQTLTTATPTAVTFDTESIDSANGHSTSSNTSRYTCQEAGTYEISGVVAFAANASGVRFAAVYLNGTLQTDSVVTHPANSAGGQTTSVPSNAILIPMVLTDYVELFGLQASGGNLATSVGLGTPASGMTVRWVST